MKRILTGFCLFLCIAGTATAQLGRGGTMYVAVKSAALKTSTGFFAGTRGTLGYGARVTVLQLNGKWAELQAYGSSLTGWTAAANLSAKQVVTGSTSSVSAKEVALAGKGFNQEVEDAYKSKGKLNYADVDKTEEQSVSEDELKKFLEDGHLSMGDK